MEVLKRLGDFAPDGEVVLVTSPGTTRRGITAEVLGILGRRRVTVFDGATENPETRNLRAWADEIQGDPQAVIAIGGGSAIDSGKVLGVLLQRRKIGDDDLSRIVDPGEMLPLIAVPTTAGTGAEVTPFATVWDFELKKKSSVAGPGLFPTTAMLDPLLTRSLPQSVTVSSGLDALSQGLEALWNQNRTPVTDACAVRAVRIALSTLEPVSAKLDDLRGRTKMLEASLLAGLAISGTRTGIAHSISYPLTAHFGIPHGLACSFTLPAIVRFNQRGARERMDEISADLGMGSSAILADRLQELLNALGVRKRIEDCGFQEGRLVDLGPEMLTPGRAENNLCAVGSGDAVVLTQEAWQSLEG